MAPTKDHAASDARPTSSAGAQFDDEHSYGSNQRGQFESYMANVKKTALLSQDRLVQIARDGYRHRVEMMRCMSQFLPCCDAVADQYDYYTNRGRKLYNFVVSYCDQSIEARDTLHEANKSLGKGKVTAGGDVKDNPENEARLAKMLDIYVARLRELNGPAAELSQSRRTELRNEVSATYMFLVLRAEEFERQCKLFEDATHEIQSFADSIGSLVSADDHLRLMQSFTVDDIDRLTASVEPASQSRFYHDAIRFKNRVMTIGLPAQDILDLRATYFAHKEQNQVRVNQIVQANLLLAAREAIRCHPTDDRLFDTCQEANQGLITAAYRYEYWLGYAFSTYACWWIKQRLNRQRSNTVNGVFTIPVSIATRANKIYRLQTQNGQPNGEPGLSHVELASRLNCTVSQVDEAITAYAPVTNSEEVFAALEDCNETLEVASQEDLDTVIQEALQSLPDDRNREICKLRWGIGYADKLTLHEVSERYNLTKERVRCIEKEGLKHLRDGEFGERLAELYAC